MLTVAIAFIVEAFVLKIDLARQEYTSRKGSSPICVIGPSGHAILYPYA